MLNGLLLWKNRDRLISNQLSELMLQLFERYSEKMKFWFTPCNNGVQKPSCSFCCECKIFSLRIYMDQKIFILFQEGN